MGKEIESAKMAGTYKDAERTIVVDLSIISFEDGGARVCYCPALDVYGYGNDEQEAIDSLGISMEEFFRYSLAKKTLISEMEKLGWTIKKQKRFTPPNLSHLLKQNKDFNKIFNTRDFHKINAGFAIPAVC